MFTTAYFIFPSIKTLSWSDIAVTYIFLTGAAGCLLLSSAYHLFQCHSQHVQRFLNKCDYVGIIVLIIGSCVPAFFYAFYCHDILKVVYIGMIVGLGLFTAYLSVSPKFSSKEWRVFRATTFVCMGLSGVIPLIHSIISFGFKHTTNALQLEYLTPMGLFYIVGAFIYGSRIPERWFPGKFNIWLHSHQIFHFFVITAAGFHYVGVIKALHWTHTFAPVCPAL
ncbi:hypothetical protein BB559_003569 [Furculomyces boomerangus]|uniref:Uncharacterized protein n=2 Tax=Harpellales TaxID=61421 RepID=A0A2T9YKH7_9FUNG|nr:hypothetical protein BB559_004339 [Furculomyces boomerangus]PVU92840.1 hypothetical protein BB559_003569 [Furculomyces boomerangus]PVZ99475.1 hypothetical protein BB558_004492 [Smittium angustum]